MHAGSVAMPSYQTMAHYGPSYQTMSPLPQGMSQQAVQPPYQSGQNYSSYSQPGYTQSVQAPIVHTQNYAPMGPAPPLSVTQPGVVQPPPASYGAYAMDHNPMASAAPPVQVPDVQIDNYGATYQKIGQQLEELLEFDRGIRQEIEVVRQQVNSTYSELKAIQSGTQGPPRHVTMQKKHDAAMNKMKDKHNALMSTHKSLQQEKDKCSKCGTDKGPGVVPPNLGYSINYDKMDAMRTHGTKMGTHAMNAHETLKTMKPHKKLGCC